MAPREIAQNIVSRIADNDIIEKVNDDVVFVTI